MPWISFCSLAFHLADKTGRNMYGNVMEYTKDHSDLGIDANIFVSYLTLNERLRPSFKSISRDSGLISMVRAQRRPRWMSSGMNRLVLSMVVVKFCICVP